MTPGARAKNEILIEEDRFNKVSEPRSSNSPHTSVNDKGYGMHQGGQGDSRRDQGKRKRACLLSSSWFTKGACVGKMQYLQPCC